MENQEQAKVTKCQNGYLVEFNDETHVVAGFDSHVALGKVISQALGVLENKKERKPRTKKIAEIKFPEI